MRWFVILVFFLVSCTHHLHVQKLIIDKTTLASFHVDTPDTRRDCPPIGERLIIHWNIAHKKFDPCKTYELKLQIKYRNYMEEISVYSIDQRMGYTTFDCLNDRYFTTGGIRTYSAELTEDRSTLDEWIHPLWYQLIQISPATP